MATEPKGPSFGYRRERWEAQNESVVIGPGWEKMGGTFTDSEADNMAKLANIAYAEGYKAGRASRDGLVEKMKRISYGLTLPETDMERAIRKVIEEALAEDEEGK